GSADPADVPADDSDQIEFLPVFEQRERYPELPDLPRSFDFNPPPDTLVDPLHITSIDGLRSTIYTGNVAELERSLGSLSDRRKLRTLNQIGVLHARFNESRLAERSFDDAIDLDPDYTTSYINLANLRIISSEPREAIALLNEVTDRRPNSALANLLLAQANQMLGNQSEARKFMVIVEERAPELASQFPHLTGGGVGRASEAQSIPVLPWPVDEE
ncbi:MAG: tetratricopeptide repeat protein, partial [Spirochaetia bacterium]